MYPDAPVTKIVEGELVVIPINYSGTVRDTSLMMRLHPSPITNNDDIAVTIAMATNTRSA